MAESEVRGDGQREDPAARWTTGGMSGYCPPSDPPLALPLPLIVGEKFSVWLYAGTLYYRHILNKFIGIFLLDSCVTWLGFP